MEPRNQLQGRKGEEIAVLYLLSLGYRILETNWRCGHLEIDIIAADHDFLLFVEVKTRASSSYGHPEEFVGKAKQRNIIRAANIYIQRTAICKEVRFDIVSVIRNGGLKQVKHIPNAFTPQW